MNLAEKYVTGLKKAYYENGGEEQWDDFEKIVHGAEEADMERLQTLYPDLPDSLYQLLKIVDGTYYRVYAGEKTAFQKGTKGQSVRFLHDPDEITVIADSFDEDLQMLMDSEYDFITEETIEEQQHFDLLFVLLCHKKSGCRWHIEKRRTGQNGEERKSKS